MTEQDAQAWIAARYGAEALARLTQMVALVIEENQRQNLIAPASVEHIWVRHVVDSLQLTALAPQTWRRWMDVGTGGGFPGLAIACVTDLPMTLIEPRRRRADFLAASCEGLGLAHATVECSNVERVQAPASIISARAVASVQKLLLATRHCANHDTIWVLPRGRVTPESLDELQSAWAGVFHVERSITDESSSILVCCDVVPR